MSNPSVAHGGSLPLLSVAPFALTLLAIAILPLVAHRWWEPLRRKAAVSMLLALPIIVLLILREPWELAHSVRDYASFICLLGSLYVISGGISMVGDLRATPAINTGFLLTGAVLSNFIGTTGASMLLIRPLLQTNQERHRVAHVPIFFIFLVSNIGGCLTPLGDPPLFLGFLRGVPFTWTLRLWPEWLFAVGMALLVFYLIDRSEYRKERPVDRLIDAARISPLRLRGSWNFLGLLGVLALVLWVKTPWREVGMAALAGLSYQATRSSIREENRFTLYPIQEVAILFFAIFITMVPALLLLESNAARIGVREPWQFFWTTGLVSSFLDNAPTYVSFSSLALGLNGIPASGPAPLLNLVGSAEGAAVLRAVSLGAVFMGANTYIGNGPNFMVKSICEAHGVRMPSFFGYMLWSGMILIPIFLLVTLIFLV